MGIFDFFTSNKKKKVLDYKVGFTSENVWVEITKKRHHFFNHELIKFWAFYFAKIMFNFSNIPEQNFDDERAYVLGLLKVTKENWNFKDLDIMKATGLNMRFLYQKRSEGRDILSYGSFFKTNITNTLITEFPFSNFSNVHIIGSVFAILQYVHDQCKENNKEYTILYHTINNMLNMYEKYQDYTEDSDYISNPSILTFKLFTIPNRAYDLAVETTNKEGPLRADSKIKFDTKIEEEAYDFATVIEEKALMSTEELYASLEVENEISREEKYDMALEFAIMFIHYIDRRTFEYLSLEERDLFLDVIERYTIAKCIGRYYSDFTKEDKYEMYRSAANHYNDLAVYYTRFKAIVSSEDSEPEEVFDTLIWNMGKRIASLKNLEDDYKKIYKYTKIIMNSIKEFKTTERLKRLANIDFL